MHPNATLITSFYAAFNAKDHEAMARCYAPDATFSDAVFRDLRGPRVTGMWRMLCTRAADLVVKVSNVDADDARGRAHWDADYTFSATGRMVHNSIDAAFTFEGGLIKTHVDTFDLWRWSSMALGAKGALLGWAPFVQNAIRKQAITGLDRFLEK